MTEAAHETHSSSFTNSKNVRLSDKAEIINRDSLLFTSSTQQRSIDIRKHDVLEAAHDESHASKFKRAPPSLNEDGPWKRKTLLSLDGGGVRSLSSLYIWKRIMKEIGTYEKSLDSCEESSVCSLRFSTCRTLKTPPPKSRTADAEDIFLAIILTTPVTQAQEN